MSDWNVGVKRGWRREKVRQTNEKANGSTKSWPERSRLDVIKKNTPLITESNQIILSIIEPPPSISPNRRVKTNTTVLLTFCCCRYCLRAWEQLWDVSLNFSSVSTIKRSFSLNWHQIVVQKLEDDQFNFSKGCNLSSDCWSSFHLFAISTKP